MHHDDSALAGDGVHALGRPVETDAPLCTPAAISLGQVLDALPDDSPWLARLEKADEDFGRVIGDHLRLRRWSSVLVDMHFPELAPDARGLVRAERGELVKRYFDAVWEAYWRFRTRRAA